MTTVRASLSFSENLREWWTIFEDQVNFSFEKRRGTYAAYASDLGLRAGEWPTHIRMTSDNAVSTFTRTSAKRDKEGDLQYFVYECTDRTTGTKLVLYND